jgi:hypothetical protein
MCSGIYPEAWADLLQAEEELELSLVSELIKEHKDLQADESNSRNTQ